MTGPREHLLWGFSIIFLWFALAEGQYGIPQAFPNFGKWCQPLNSTELRECEQQIAPYPKKQVGDQASEIPPTVYESGLEDGEIMVGDQASGIQPTVYESGLEDSEITVWDQASEIQWLYSTVYKYGQEDRVRQGPLCDLLLRNDDIIRNYCSGAISPTSLEMVKYELSQMLTYTNLDKFNTSELRLVFNSIVETVEASLLVTFFKSPQNTNVNTSELEIHMKVARDVCVGEARSLILSDSANTMEVPCTHVRGETSGAILVSYLGLGFRVDGKLPGVLGKDREEIISGIVSGAITNPITEDLDPPVTFYLEHQKEVPSTFTVQCVFWDKEQRAWSSRGCKTMKSDRDEITLCVCNHLSTFAVLMAPSDIQEDHGLVVISWIGLILSLLCLCLSLLTFILCRSLRNAHTSVLTALCGCLFVGQLLVLTGLHLTANKVLCAVIAGLLQFSFLCAFCWMSLESALLFMTVRNLQAMNYMTSRRSHFPYVCLAGFGIPAIIITISAAIRPDGYGTDKYCWLKLDLIWSFLGPVCVFITINFILLVLTFVLLRKKLSSLNANVSTLKNTRLLTFKALSQLFILGCTWIFGIFQFGSSSLVMSYIFTICNSLQGLYIFCVHCLLNRQVWKEYMTGFNKFHSKKSELDTLSGNTVPTTLKQQMDHTHQTLPNQEKIYENLMCRQLSPAYSQEPGVRGLPERQFVNFNPKIPPKMVPGLTQARAEFLQ